MLKPVVAFFHSVHDRGTAMICQGIGQYRRYTTALCKALQAAQVFLRVPNGTTVFEPLTPVLLDLPSSQRYERELLSALANDQVRNIAITGEYGAGKSSVIRTFVDRHPEFNFAFISLAAFGKERDQAGDSRGPRCPPLMTSLLHACQKNRPRCRQTTSIFQRESRKPSFSSCCMPCRQSNCPKPA